MGRSKRKRVSSVSPSFPDTSCASQLSTTLRGDDTLTATGLLQPSAESGVVASHPDEEDGTASDHFSRPEIFFQLEAEKRRSGRLFARDIGSLLLWSVPCAVPLIECPRVFFLKNKSRLRDVVVIYVNGWTHNDMILSGVNGAASVSTVPVHLPPDSPCDDKDCNDSSAPLPPRKRPRMDGTVTSGGMTEEGKLQWAERISLAMLAPIREQKCWARQECGVQFSPMLLPDGKCTLQQEIFWRNDAPKVPGEGKRYHHSARSDHSASEATDAANCNGVDAAKPASSTSTSHGVASLFHRALAIHGNTTTNATCHTKTNCTVAMDSEGTATAMLSPSARDDTSLWDDRDTLLLHALTITEHRTVLESLTYVLDIPTDEDASEWTTFDAAPSSSRSSSSSSGSANGGAALPRVFALDCEMVVVSNRVRALARVTLVDVRRSVVVLDTLVKPTDEVVDYVTRFSGVDEEMLKDVETTLQDCQRELKRFIDTETFLVGHSLENDLKACKLLPNCYLLDSAHLYPHPSGLPFKNALRFLALRYLQKKIQQGAHDSAEDASISAELVYLKLQNGPQFGIRSRVSVLRIMEHAAVPMCEESKVLSPSVELHLFDDACVLRDLVPDGAGSRTKNGNENGDDGGDTGCRRGTKKGLLDAVPVRNDRDAVRKAVRCLRQRQSAQKGTKDGVPPSYSLTWLQLTETVVRGGATVQYAHESKEQTQERSWEELQLKRVEDTNRHVLEVVRASPHNTLIVVVVAGEVDCIKRSNTNKPLSSTPGGVCFAFVKDEKAVGPPAHWLDAGEAPSAGYDNGLATPPACRQQ